MTMNKMDLAELRRYARYELDVLIEHRCRAGEDPYDFIHDLPTVDELVVFELRADALEARGMAAQYAMAKHAAQSSLPDAAMHRQNIAKLEYDLLRGIALEHPDLTRTVWTLLGTVSD
jgi:phage tail protein X